jgi:hypothetical protein
LPYFHSVMIYGIIFWGNSPHNIHTYRLQKSIIRIITNSRSRESAGNCLRKLKILPFKSQSIFPLLLFIIKNRQQFKSDSEIHSINTRYKNNFHYPMCNLTLFQKRNTLFWNQGS